MPNNNNSAFQEVYNTIVFHPSSEIGIVATPKHIDLFKIENSSNKNENRHIRSFGLGKFDIERIALSHDATELVVGSKHAKGMFHVIDMETGESSHYSLRRGDEKTGLRGFDISPDGSLMACKSGGEWISLINTDCKEIINNFKMNSRVEAVSFSTESSKLYSTGTAGQVYVWDVRYSKRCCHKFWDQGCVKGTTLRFSPNGQFLATGSDTGVVNIYKTEDLMKSENPKPVKAVMNLVTEVTSLAFSPNSEILAMSSWFKESSVRLLHVSSMSVFSNFPLPSIKYHKIADVKFTPHSGFFAFCGQTRDVNLFRLCHYDNY